VIADPPSYCGVKLTVAVVAAVAIAVPITGAAGAIGPVGGYVISENVAPPVTVTAFG
jgi:hypothetical protein